MATRAIYVFKDSYSSYAVYKHWDGYPSQALEFIQNALTKAYKLPRFDPSEFACAFIAANKEAEGDFHLVHYWDLMKNSAGEEFTYIVTIKNNELWIKYKDWNTGTIHEGTIEGLRLI
jgi:hypothetical protein